jgi:hypothetical protein
LIRREFLFLAAGTALPPEEFAGMTGQPVLVLAQHPAVFPRLRVMSAGRQRVVSDTLRGRGPGLGWHEGWLHGWAGTEEARVFLAYEPSAEQVALMLWEQGRPSLFIPPRFAPWPEALRVPLRGFNPELEAQLRWG